MSKQHLCGLLVSGISTRESNEPNARGRFSKSNGQRPLRFYHFGGYRNSSSLWESRAIGTSKAASLQTRCLCEPLGKSDTESPETND